ncbi:MAG: type II secretion system protein [Candidatus Gastranaerophilales bacterium]|nr:type II secretion system protein [Candidatus Gastranaerophilales bacterium]
MKKAFTLSEIVVVLVITAIIILVTIYSFGNMQPEKNKIMFKKAYSVVERVSQELANDESIYPYDPENIGFKNTERACVLGNNTECYEGASKFQMFFARRLNLVEEPSRIFATYYGFETTDGIKWGVGGENLAGRATGRQIIMVDVNGEKGPNSPNCQVSAFNGSVLEERIAQIFNEENIGPLDERDRFFIIVDFDGRARVVPNSLEAEYLRSQEVRKKD